MSCFLLKGVSKKVSDYNLPRQCIRNYFPSPRKCFVFPSPASPENMTRLESLQERDLVPDFLEVTRWFCQHIFHNSVVKTVKGGHRVTGKCECFTSLILKRFFVQTHKLLYLKCSSVCVCCQCLDIWLRFMSTQSAVVRCPVWTMQLLLLQIYRTRQLFMKLWMCIRLGWKRLDTKAHIPSVLVLFRL